MGIQNLLSGLDVEPEIANQVRAQEENLHQDSTWRARKRIMDYPDDGTDRHELAQELVALAK